MRTADQLLAAYPARVAVVFPAGVHDDPHRAAAFEYVEAWYAEHFPRWPRAVGTCGAGPWSKGNAVRDAIENLDAPADVLVIADADSFVADPATLAAAALEVVAGRQRWVTPHGYVYRLKPAETERVLAGAKPRIGATIRAPYEGPVGGGITVVALDAYAEVGGIDPRFLGWGGEDLAFGWALETLCQPGMRMDAPLIHLWHPHPAPNLRGSLLSEEIVARYQAARGLPRRMRWLIDHGTLPDIDPVDPVTFRMLGNRRTYRIAGGERIVRFDRGTYTTTDPDEIDALRSSGIVAEERRKAST